MAAELRKMLIGLFLTSSQAHLHLSGLLPGLCVLRLFRRSHGGSRERTRHTVLAQREVGLCRGPICHAAPHPTEILHQGDIDGHEAPNRDI